jgi:hypothetical protein
MRDVKNKGLYFTTPKSLSTLTSSILTVFSETPELVAARSFTLSGDLEEGMCLIVGAGPPLVSSHHFASELARVVNSLRPPCSLPCRPSPLVSTLLLFKRMVSYRSLLLAPVLSGR